MRQVLTSLAQPIVLFLFPFALVFSQEPIPRSKLITRITNAYPVYSPDGKSIAYMSNADGDFDIYVLSLDEQKVTKLTNASGQDGTPVWSPDGLKIAFRSMRDGNSQIYVMDLDGKNQKNVSRNSFGDEHPFWSSDGKRILFSSDRTTPQGRKEKNYDLFEMSAEGGDVRQITHTDEVETYGSWSPDGSRIVCRKILADGNWEIALMNRDGSSPVNLSKHPGLDGWPVWSPDGKWIAYSSERKETMRLFVIKPDGTGKRQITDDDRATEDRQPSWHPKGSGLLFARYQWFPDEVWYEAAEIRLTLISKQ